MADLDDAPAAIAADTADAPLLLHDSPSKDGVIVDLRMRWRRSMDNGRPGADADLAGEFETALLAACAEEEIGDTPDRFLDVAKRWGRRRSP